MVSKYMNKVFRHVGDLMNRKVTHNMMRLIAEGLEEDDQSADNYIHRTWHLKESVDFEFIHLPKKKAMEWNLGFLF